MNNKALSIATATLLASINANAQVVFEADFDAATAADFGGNIGFGALITESNLNAGTAIGTWTVNQAQDVPTNRNARMIQTDGGADVTEKALRFGINMSGTINVDTAVLTANLASALSLFDPIAVSFDYGIISGDAGTRTSYLTGLDGSGNRVFQVGFVNTTGKQQMGYFDTIGEWTLIGTSGDLIGNNNTYWNASRMKNVTIEVGASSYDIKLDGVTLTGGGGIAFRDASASGLVGLAFSANTKWTGGAFDNMTVSQVSGPEPFAITEIEHDPDAQPLPTVTLTWRKTAAANYIAYVSHDLGDWDEDLEDSITSEDDERPEDADHITMTFPLAGDRAEAEDLFFRIEEG